MVIDYITKTWHSFLQWGTEANTLPYAVALLIAVAGGVVLWLKPHWATIPHELGHAFVALFLGKKISGININKDSSGDTRTLEYKSSNPVTAFFTAPFRWLRGLLVSFSGYPAPFALSLGLLYFWSNDQSKIAVILLVILLAFSFLYSTNFYGFFLVLGGLILTGLSLWIEYSLVREIFVLLIAGGMLSGGVKGVVEAWQVYSQDTKMSTEKWHDPDFQPQHSDARALSQKTLLPQVVWLTIFSGIGVFLVVYCLILIASAY